MDKLAEFMSGTLVLEEADSPINGKLTVIKDLAWGTHIAAGGLTQSGGIAKQIWQTPLKKIKKSKISSCLILGYGGGSIAQIVEKYWPKANIVGVDIDEVFVELGKKHLYSEESVTIHIDDAYEFIKSASKKYDLVCVDTYIGDEYPEKLESAHFLKGIKKALSRNGITIFNRLYYDKKRIAAKRFESNLEKVFASVEVVYPAANIMFVCKG